MAYKDISGRQKAAILLMALGTDLSSQVIRHLREDEIEKITLEIACLPKTPPDIKEKVIKEFYDMCVASDYISTEGIEYARKVLEKALGPNRAYEMMTRMKGFSSTRPFDLARRTEPCQLLNFIQDEHPQTIALILSYLNYDQAAVILSALPESLQVEVTKRIAVMDQTSPEVLREVESVLEKKLSSLAVHDFTISGGTDTVIGIFGKLNEEIASQLLSALREQAPELANEIEGRSFTFEDVIMLDDHLLQTILPEINLHDLALALKIASEEAQHRVYRNLSKQDAERLHKEIQSIGAVRILDAEEAQQKIANAVKQLGGFREAAAAKGKESEAGVQDY